MTQNDQTARIRLGVRANALMEAEAGDDRPTAQHLETAIAKLEAVDPAIVGSLKTMNRNMARLSSMILAHVMTEEDEVNEALKELQQAIMGEIKTATQDTRMHDPKLPELQEVLERRVVEIVATPKAKDREIADRER